METTPSNSTTHSKHGPASFLAWVIGWNVLLSAIAIAIGLPLKGVAGRYRTGLEVFLVLSLWRIWTGRWLWSPRKQF